MSSILLIDNNDSFTANLEHLLAIRTGTVPTIVPYDRIRETAIIGYDLVVISPGPGSPAEYPDYACILGGDTPILGICGMVGKVAWSGFLTGEP